MRMVVLLSALLSGCAAHGKVVYRDRTIEVPVPVIQPVPAELLRGCQPRTSVPARGVLTVGDVFERLDAVEVALAMCANQIEIIRARQSP